MAASPSSSEESDATFELPYHPPGPSTRKLDRFSSLPLELKYDVAEFMSPADLAHLAGCTHLWNQFCTATLYKRDARDNNSSAIKWAVMINYEDGGHGVGLRTLDLAIRNHGDVNAVYEIDAGDDGTGYATALHIAAAMGRLTFCKKLLRNGADVSAPSEKLYCLRGIVSRQVIESKLLNRNLRVSIKRGTWFPLLIPFVLGHENVSRLLLKQGAPPDLSMQYDERLGQWNSATILHVLVANDKRSTIDGDGNCYFKKFDYVIDTRLPGGGDPPIHIALQNPNLDILDKIIEVGADLEITNSIGRTPLLQAICYCLKTPCPDMRKKYLDFIERLIEASADVNAHSHNVATSQTPLLAAIQAIPDDWKPVLKEARVIIRLLLKHGADVTARSSMGLNPVHAICQAIHQRDGNTTALASILNDLIEGKGEVVLNTPYPDGDSILKKALVDYDQRPCFLLRTIIPAGATIQNHEADAVLMKWLTSTGLRSTKKWYDFDVMDHKHKRHITQRAVNEAYRYAFDVEPKLYETIRMHFPRTTIGEELVAKMFASEKTKLGGAALDLPFDGRYVDENGDNFLHMIVNRLEAVSSYRESTAIFNAEVVIDNGAQISHRNRNGMTVLQRLRVMKKPYCDLRLFLYEERDRQSGEF